MFKNQYKMDLFSHLHELKKRLFYACIFLAVSFCISYYFSDKIFQIISKPLLNILDDGKRKIIYTNLTEAFITHIKLSFYVSLLFSIPFILIQIYIFISPALYKKEKRAFLPFLIISPLLFYFGAYFAYEFILPTAFKFFLTFEKLDVKSQFPIEFQAKISEYFSLVLQITIAFGIAFQLPVLLTLLVKFNIITVQKLKEKRKFAIVIIFAIAAVITPPDVLSQIGLAVPMVMLYELSIIACKYITIGK